MGSTAGVQITHVGFVEAIALCRGSDLANLPFRMSADIARIVVPATRAGAIWADNPLSQKPSWLTSPVAGGVTVPSLLSRPERQR